MKVVVDDSLKIVKGYGAAPDHERSSGIVDEEQQFDRIPIGGGAKSADQIQAVEGDVFQPLAVGVQRRGVAAEPGAEKRRPAEVGLALDGVDSCRSFRFFGANGRRRRAREGRRFVADFAERPGPADGRGVPDGCFKAGAFPDDGAFPLEQTANLLRIGLEQAAKRGEDIPGGSLPVQPAGKDYLLSAITS